MSGKYGQETGPKAEEKRGEDRMSNRTRPNNKRADCYGCNWLAASADGLGRRTVSVTVAADPVFALAGWNSHSPSQCPRRIAYSLLTASDHLRPQIETPSMLFEARSKALTSNLRVIFYLYKWGFQQSPTAACRLKRRQLIKVKFSVGTTSVNPTLN